MRAEFARLAVNGQWPRGLPSSVRCADSFSLANVRKMVEKYQGFMDVSNTNQIFTVKIMLYL